MSDLQDVKQELKAVSHELNKHTAAVAVLTETTKGHRHSFNSELRNMRGLVEERLRHIEDLVEEHETMLYGDGNGHPGLRLRTDRLEQAEKRRDNVLSALALGMLGFILDAAKRYLWPGA